MTFQIRKIENIPNEEKIKEFEKLYRIAEEYLEFVKNDYNCDEAQEYKHYMYEKVMGLLGEDIWDEIDDLIT